MTSYSAPDIETVKHNPNFRLFTLVNINRNRFHLFDILAFDDRRVLHALVSYFHAYYVIDINHYALFNTCYKLY